MEYSVDANSFLHILADIAKESKNAYVQMQEISFLFYLFYIAGCLE
jgi:hypothetical protein